MSKKCLKEISIDDKDLEIIIDLYWCQTAKLHVEGESDPVTIKR